MHLVSLGLKFLGAVQQTPPQAPRASKSSRSPTAVGLDAHERENFAQGLLLGEAENGAKSFKRIWRECSHRTSNRNRITDKVTMETIVERNNEVVAIDWPTSYFLAKM